MKSILILGGHDHKPNARGEEEMVLSTNCANNLLTDDVGSWWFGNHCHCCEPHGKRLAESLQGSTPGASFGGP